MEFKQLYDISIMGEVVIAYYYTTPCGLLQQGAVTQSSQGMKWSAIM